MNFKIQYNSLHKSKMNFVIILALSAILIVLSSGCSLKQRQVEIGFAALESGNFDAALERFQRLYENYPDDPEIIKGMGYVLSLRKITLMSSVYLLEESLSRMKDKRARNELFKIYMDAALFDRAEKLLASEKISVEEFLSQEISIYRAALICMKEPSPFSASTLRKIPESPLRNYFLARCMMEESYRPESLKEIKGIIDSMDDEELRCELESLFPPDKIEDEIRHRVVIRNCRTKFPGSLTLWRERPLRFEEVQIPKLFDDHLLIPNDPDLMIMEQYKKLVEEKSENLIN
ncbi:MAG: hypothetical protein OEZ34_15105 [Spirochaetia bacterium]|nr:hypothetical protein [Spirochaetia bacterium]